MAAAVDGAIGGRILVPGTHGKHQMFEFSRFELIVHDSAGGVVFRVVTWIITVIIGAVRALCENAPLGLSMQLFVDDVLHSHAKDPPPARCRHWYPSLREQCPCQSHRKCCFRNFWNFVLLCPL